MCQANLPASRPLHIYSKKGQILECNIHFATSMLLNNKTNNMGNAINKYP